MELKRVVMVLADISGYTRLMTMHTASLLHAEAIIAELLEAVIDRQFEDLGGEDAIVIHRLLKNSIPAKEYIVMTEAFYELSGGLAGQTPEARTEECEGIGPVAIRVYYPTGEEPPLPPPPSPFSPPSAEYKALSARFNAHTAHRMQGREPPPNFAHLPNARLTPFDWLRVVGGNVIFIVTVLPKALGDHLRRKR